MKAPAGDESSGVRDLVQRRERYSVSDILAIGKSLLGRRKVLWPPLYYNSALRFENDG